MSSRRPSVRFYPADFYAAVQPFPAAAAGIAILLLCHYWQAGSIGLPNQAAELCRLCKCSAVELHAAWPLVRQIFFVDCNGLLQEQKKAQPVKTAPRVIHPHHLSTPHQSKCAVANPGAIISA
jgi:uncharacterized protein YdaU (DUF1376 family)